MSDDFAKKFLGAEEALHSERVTHRAVLALLFAGILFTVSSLGLGVAAVLMEPSFFVHAGLALVMGLASLFFGLFFATSRIVVSKDTLVIHHGRERRIPLRAITDASVVAMDLAARMRMRREGASDFGARGGRTHAVRVAYAEGNDTKIVYLPANDPAALVALLTRKVRVRAEGSDELAAAPADIDAEAEAEEAAEAVAPARQKA